MIKHIKYLLTGLSMLIVALWVVGGLVLLIKTGWVYLIGSVIGVIILGIAYIIGYGFWEDK